MLTTAQFQNAITRYIDSTKPDPLARGQIEQLNLCWEQHDDNDVGVIASGSNGGGEDESLTYTWKLNGTFTISSEYISIAIRAICNCKIRGDDDVTKDDEEDANKPDDDVGRVFENEFYIRLSITAKLLPMGGEEEDAEQKKKKTKQDRKEHATKRKLHAGMIKRLQSDRLIRCLLLDNDGKDDTKQNTNNAGSDNILLCEALILQNPMHTLTSNTHHCQRSTTSGGGGEQLEERVNVNDGTLEGIRNAIFSHTEDNLDVLELLLNMPYLPRSCRGNGDGSSATASTQGIEYSNIQTKTRDVLGDRVYLRLLEDAMFDSCEREGGDDMLDDLNISSDHAATNNNEEGEEVAADSSKRGRRRQKC